MKVLDDQKADFWKRVAITLMSVLIAVVTTYAAVSREYATKAELKELSALVMENTKMLNKVLGYLDRPSSNER